MTFNNVAKLEIARLIASKKWVELIAFVGKLKNDVTGESNKRSLEKFSDFLYDGKPRWKIFAANGNEKLPFVSFSSLPGADFCPGAGDCLEWCYSFKSWRYPDAFMRQAQNAILLQSFNGRRKIESALDEFAGAGSIDLRLYVDGDFSTGRDIAFWMQLLSDRPWLNAYGYSKSWALFLDYAQNGGQFPGNYRLNLSSGSKYGEKEKALMKALPITRGEFVAVSIGQKVKASDHGTKATNKALRDAYKQKAFTCPGKCGECTPKGHACGSSRFDNIDIIIAVH